MNQQPGGKTNHPEFLTHKTNLPEFSFSGLNTA